MNRLCLCISSQTPLVRFNLSYEDLVQKYRALDQPVDLSRLVEGEDYEFTAGGVTRMVFPLLKRMLQEGRIVNPHWISLNPTGPEKVTTAGITLDHVQLERNKLKGHGYAKETMWKALHGIQKGIEPVYSLLWQDEFVD